MCVSCIFNVKKEQFASSQYTQREKQLSDVYIIQEIKKGIFCRHLTDMVVENV